MIGLQRLKRLGEVTGHLPDLVQLFRRKIVDVHVHRVAGMNLVLDAVQSGHQHCREREVGVGGGVRTAELHAPGLG